MSYKDIACKKEVKNISIAGVGIRHKNKRQQEDFTNECSNGSETR